MRLAPRSLYARMVLVVVGGLVVAQWLSTLILFDERAHWFLQSRINRSSHRIADSVQVLDRVAPAWRAAVAEAMAAEGYQVRISAAPPTLPAGAAGLEQATAGFVAQLGENLRRQVAPDQPMRVALRFTPDTPVPARAWFKPFEIPVPATTVDVVLPGSDPMQWYWIRMQLPADSRGLPQRVYWDLLIRLGLLVALLLLAVSWVVRPLSVLAQAAGRLGRNLDQPPVPERGPSEVRRAAQAFNQMQTRLRDLLAEKARMLAAVSHDLKTPITRLRLRAELLSDGELQTELQAKISRDLDEMEAMVVATLDLMRGSGTVEPLVRTDVQALLESLQADYEDTGHALVVEDSVVTPIELRPQALRRCLSNLIDNGLKYGQRVRLRAVDSAEQLCLEIDDDGPGIPAEFLERAFEPFFRLEASRNRETGGSGLGLAIARAIALEHAGRLTLSNRTAGGLRATLILPRR